MRQLAGFANCSRNPEAASAAKSNTRSADPPLPRRRFDVDGSPICRLRQSLDSDRGPIASPRHLDERCQISISEDRVIAHHPKTSRCPKALVKTRTMATLRDLVLEVHEAAVVLCLMNNRIVIDPKVCHGEPVIRGTRLPVAIVVGSLAGGMTFDEVQREYGITSDDICAALQFAGDLVEQEEHHLLLMPTEADTCRRAKIVSARTPAHGRASLCSPYGFGGSPGFAAVPGAGGAPPAGGPPGISSSGAARMSCSVNDSG
jgi:uncharacterized protein (DUF433 family)